MKIETTLNDTGVAVMENDSQVIILMVPYILREYNWQQFVYDKINSMRYSYYRRTLNKWPLRSSLVTAVNVVEVMCLQ